MTNAIKRLADVKKPPGVRILYDRAAQRDFIEWGDDMTEAAKEARRSYRRQWQRQNKDKVREYQRRYWEKKAAEAAAADQDRE